MSDIAIRVEDISKLYKIGVKSHDTIKDLLASSLNGFFRRPTTDSEIRNSQSKPSPVPGLPSADGSQSDFIWALKDVSFDVKQGETLGIIGANGAGKSTLLKILSRITEPTSGRAEVYGRVGSLLEVGTGFDRELTGRENIYLNGAVLGMKKAEIDRKFDEIVDFSGVEKFIDTPIKRYSSGMYVRLAFAVAAHLEPEILIVDEVLAVGDAEFQKKCLGKMGDVAKGGRTVLFVSHNMTAVESLCNRCILLTQGSIGSEGDPTEVVGQYLISGIDRNSGVQGLLFHPGRTSNSIATMSRVALYSGSDVPTSYVKMGSSLSVHVHFLSESSPIRPVLGVVFKNSHRMPIFGVNNKFIGGYQFSETLSHGTISCHFDALPLVPGTYLLDLYLGNSVEDIDVIYDAITIEVLPSDIFGTGQLPPASAGPIYWPARWTIRNDNTTISHEEVLQE